MKKIISFLLAAALMLSLAGCAGSGTPAEVLTEASLSDADYTLTPADVETPLDGGGAAIAVVVGPAGVEDGGYYAVVWKGVRKFSQNFNFIPQSYAAADTSADAYEAAVRQAAESGAGLLVCAGPELETAVYKVQSNYPTVSYLLLEGEPHNADYSSYQITANTHSVLFREEQAGYLAGYAAVAEGHTSLGFLGGETMPGNVRYGTGFLQGAEAAAEAAGVEAAVKFWFSGVDAASEEITTKMSGWYADGTQVIFAAGGNLARSCTAAAAQAGGLVIAAGYDQSALGEMVLTSAETSTSRVVQNELYGFFTGGSSWGEQAGKAETLGAAADAVGLVTAGWKFNVFTPEKYAEVYANLKNGITRVGRYSDLSAMPDTPALSVDFQNMN